MSCTADVMHLPHTLEEVEKAYSMWGSTSAVHIQSKLASICVSALIGGTPVALIESAGRYWVRNSDDAVTASFNILCSSLWF